MFLEKSKEMFALNTQIAWYQNKFESTKAEHIFKVTFLVSKVITLKISSVWDLPS